MGTLKFSDGIEIDTSGPLHVLELHDGCDVVVQGRLLPVKNREEGLNRIKKLKGDKIEKPRT